MKFRESRQEPVWESKKKRNPARNNWMEPSCQQRQTGKNKRGRRKTEPRTWALSNRTATTTASVGGGVMVLFVFFFAVGVFFFVSLGVPKTRVACAPLERALNDAAEVRSAFLSPAVAEISSLGDKRPIEKKTGKENGKNEKKGPRSRRKQSNRSNTSDSSNRSLKCVQRLKPS